MSLVSPGKFAAALLASLTIVACGPPDEADRAKAGPINGPFVVSNFFTPSGFMGDGAIPGRLTVGINKNCKTPRPPGAQGDCYHFLYRPLGGATDAKWAGAFWVYPTNSWGSVPGRQVIGPKTYMDAQGSLLKGPDGKELRGYSYVRFYAAVDPVPQLPPEKTQISDLTKPVLLNYWAGGIDGRKATPPQPYFDTGCEIPSDVTMPPRCIDVGGSAHFFQALGNDRPSAAGDWQQFKLNLDGWTMDSVMGAFGWSVDSVAFGGQTLSLYIDDIVWE